MKVGNSKRNQGHTKSAVYLCSESTGLTGQPQELQQCESLAKHSQRKGDLGSAPLLEGDGAFDDTPILQSASCLSYT